MIVPSKQRGGGANPAKILAGMLTAGVWMLLTLPQAFLVGQDQPSVSEEVPLRHESAEPVQPAGLDEPGQERTPPTLDTPTDPEGRVESEAPPEVEIPEQPPQPIIADPLRQQFDEAEGPLPLNRGPIHEAFAEPLSLDPQPGLIVPEGPPEPIEEIPPETRPDDANLAWFPGYWGWDAELERYVWVSGSWRRPPPYRRWLPGYWNEVDGGWQWVPGTWIQADQQQMEYLPEPPESLETGPTTDAPSEQHIWIPGCWMWQQGRYAWRPGYWSMAHPDWVWMPHRYLWTPYGCVFSRGYWDYPLARRGWLFAPYYFPYHRAGFFFSPFTPGFLISHHGLLGNLWIWPGYRHYFFGNYFGLAGRYPGFVPWHQFHGSRLGYDPLFWHHGRGYPGGVRAFQGAAQRDFDRWARDPQLRPPVNARDLESFRGRVGESDFARGSLARSLRDGIDRGELGGSRQLSAPQRRDLADGSRRMREFAGQRRQFESRAASQLADADRAVRRSEPLGLPSTRATERRDVRPPPVSRQLSGRRGEITRQDLQRSDLGRGITGRGPSVSPGLQPSRRPTDLGRGLGGMEGISPQFRGGSPRSTAPQFRGGGIPGPSRTPGFRGGGIPGPSGTPSFRGGGTPRSPTPGFRGGGGAGGPSTPSFRGGGGRSSGPSIGGGAGSRGGAPARGGGGGGGRGSGGGFGGGGRGGRGGGRGG